MKKKNRLVACLLCVAMLLAGFLADFWLAGGGPAHAADGGLDAWFSSVKGGGTISLLEKGSEAHVNYHYERSPGLPESEGAYDAHVTVANGGGVILNRQYSNVGDNSVSIGMLDEGTYELTVSIVAGGNIVAAHSAVLECVAGLPVIDMQPSDVETEPGREVSFAVSSPTEDAAFQWFSTDSLSDAGRAVSGASDSTLTISASNVVGGLDGTYYYCQISANGHAVNSNYARLSVHGAGVLPGNSPAPGGDASTKAPAGTATPKPAASAPSGGGTTPPSAMPKPTKAACTVRASYSIAGHRIRVAWNQCGKSYKVYRSTKKNSGYKLKKTLSATSFVDKNISQGKTYYYKVKALDGRRAVALSGIASARVDARPRIMKYSARKKGKSIKVAWKFDHADRICIYVDAGNGWGMLGSVKGTKTGCSIGVPKGYARVRVRVRAYNKVGRKKYYGPYSKTRTIRV